MDRGMKKPRFSAGAPVKNDGVEQTGAISLRTSRREFGVSIPRCEKSRNGEKPSAPVAIHNWSRLEQTGAVEGICSSGIYKPLTGFNINHDWSSLFAEDRTGAVGGENKCKSGLLRNRRKGLRLKSTANVSIWSRSRIIPRLMDLDRDFWCGKQNAQHAVMDFSQNHHGNVCRRGADAICTASRADQSEHHRQPIARRWIGAAA